VTDKNIS